MIQLYEKFKNQFSSFSQLLKIEAIQTSLFIDVSDVLDIILFEMSQRRSQNLSLNDFFIFSRTFERLY